MCKMQKPSVSHKVLRGLWRWRCWSQLCIRKIYKMDHTIQFRDGAQQVESRQLLDVTWFSRAAGRPCENRSQRVHHYADLFSSGGFRILGRSRTVNYSHKIQKEGVKRGTDAGGTLSGKRS